MSNTPHELTEEFPQHVQLMHDLRATDAHFARLSDEYAAINKAVHRAETDIEPTSDDHLVQMRKQRLFLKDQIHGYLEKAAS